MHPGKTITVDGAHITVAPSEGRLRISVTRNGSGGCVFLDEERAREFFEEVSDVASHLWRTKPEDETTEPPSRVEVVDDLPPETEGDRSEDETAEAVPEAPAQDETPTA